MSFFTFPETLIRLNLSENRIGDSGVKTLSDYIIQRNNSHLLSINLEYNNISTAGAQHLLKAVSQSSIVSVFLRRNKILVHMCMLDFFKAVQLNYLRYFVNKQGQRLLE
jgi:hypothetical protein